MTKDEQIEILEHDIRNSDDIIEELGSEKSDLEDKIGELENILSDVLIDKEHFEQRVSYLEDELNESQDEVSSLERDCSVLEDKVAELQEQLDEWESPTFGMSISQISCYEVFMDILERLPVGAHEIEEKLLELYGK